MHNILITGSGGMLGKAVYQVLTARGYNVTATDIDLNEIWLKKLDVREIKDFYQYFDTIHFDTIFHLAALTDLEYCEENPQDAWATNALGAENAKTVAQKYGSDLIYISTAGIFDNPEQEYFHDYDDPSPKSIYGKSKYAGEKEVLKYKNSYVFRAGWMMGGEDKDKKFVKKILNQLKAGAKELNVVDDKLGTPTYTLDFAMNMIPVIELNEYGLYNQVCKGDCSRYDVAVKMVELLGLDIKVNKVDSSFFTEYYAPRPYSEKLINFKLDMRGRNNMRHWEECLTEYMKNYGSRFIR
jgi:dTDP-4-dehydrorhamnose reductase